MILSGILHSSLGGFTVIRGVAPLGDLALCSEFDAEYQRNLIDTHKAEIERFLADRQYLFFPEVILSASLQFDFNTYKGSRSVAPIADIHSGAGFTSNVNGVTVKTVSTKLPKALETVGADNAPRLAYLTLPEEQVENGLKLFRIDGNHRLSAAQGAKPGEANYNLPTPFCIVLHDDATLAQKFEKVVFHNINAKQVPLTSEENLRLILDEGPESLFTDKDLLESPSFGPAYYLARKLLSKIDDGYLSELANPLKNRRTLALALTQFLSGRDAAIKKAKAASSLDKQVPRLREAFQKVNELYRNHSKLAENGCHGVLVSFLYFALHNGGRQLGAFTRWVTGNRIDQFNKGHSYTINDEILKVIEGSGLLIADLTFGNRNVYHEIGYLMGLNRGKGLEQENFILIADKHERGDELESDIGFNLKNWQQIRFESTRQLEAALTESIEVYYDLKGEV